MGFPLHEIEEDYELKIGKGDIIPILINKKQYDQRTKRGSNQLSTELKVESSATFDKNLRKIKVLKVTNSGTTTTYNFQYDSKGRLKKYWSKGGRYGDTYENYNYQGNANFTRTKSFKEGDGGIKYIYTKTDYGYLVGGDDIKKKIIAENNLVKKIIHGYDRNQPSETLYFHNESGKVIKRETGYTTLINQYNSKGDLKFFKETNKRNGNTTSRTYVYKYDKYGNWIIQMNLLDMSIARGIPSFPNPTIRKITYSNGETTGFDDITNLEVVNHLKELRNQLKNTEPKTASWKRLDQNRFNFYINGKVVSKEVNSGFMWLSLLVFHKPSKTLFICEDYAKKPSNQFHEAQKININLKEGYWYKNKDGSVAVFTNEGTYLEENILFTYAPNNNDVYYQGKNEKSPVVLLDYKNVEIHKVYATHNYEEYLSNKIVNKVTKSNCLIGDCENGYAEFKDSDGVRFEVFLQNGKPYGPGLLYKNGTDEVIFTTFEGSYTKTSGFVYSFIEGRYTNFKDDQKKIAFSNDLKTGETVKIIYNNNNPYKKVLSNNGNNSCMLGDCYSDIGVKKYDNKVYYFGMFSNGKRHGFGHLKFNNGDFYIGNFYHGEFHGIGKYTWKSGAYYMGEYKYGKYHGKGVLFNSDNSHKAGTWKDGNYLGK